MALLLEEPLTDMCQAWTTGSLKQRTMIPYIYLSSWFRPKLSMCWTYAGTQSSLSCQTWSKRLTAFVFAPGSDHKRSLSGECKHRLLLFHLKDETQRLGISTCSPVLSVIDCKRLSFSHFIKNSVSLSNYLWVSKMRDVALKLLIKAHSLHLRVTNKV